MRRRSADCRKQLELRADGTRTTWSYKYCAGIAGGTAICPSGATHLVEVKAQAPDGATKIGPTATNYYDQLDRVIAVAQAHGVADDPVIRQRLAWCHSKVEIMRYLGMRTLTQFLAGKHPGPDAAIFEPSAVR